MDRLEFSGETPIPVIKGTNYEQAFADRDAVRRRIADAKAAGPTDLSGPYSSLFDWKQEEKDLQAQKEKTQLAQLKIMRTNSIGEVFRVLGEGMAAAKGAPVAQRNPNPFILNAINEYGKSDIDYINKLEGVKTKRLALAKADMEYEFGQNAAAVDKAEKQYERSHQESITAQKEVENYIRELKLQENLYRLRGKEAEAEGIRGQIKLGEQAMLEIEVARNKARFDRGMDLVDPKGDGKKSSSNINVRTVPEKGDRTKMEFIVPDTQETIYLPQGLVDHIRTFLQHGKGQYDQTVPVVLRDAMKNNAVKPEALYTAISDSWDYIKANVLPPDVYSQIYGGEPGQETAVQGTQTATADSTATQQTAGAPANEEEILQQEIWDNLTADTSFLTDNKKTNKKIAELGDKIYANYLRQKDNKKTKNDAITEANQIIANFRKLQR